VTLALNLAYHWTEI